MVPCRQKARYSKRRTPGGRNRKGFEILLNPIGQGNQKGSRSIWSLFSAKTFLYYKKDKQLVKFDTLSFLLKLQNEDGELTWVAPVSCSRLVLCQFIKCLTQTQSHDNQTRLITLQAAQGKVWTLSAKMLLVSPLRQEVGKPGSEFINRTLSNRFLLLRSVP